MLLEQHNNQHAFLDRMDRHVETICAQSQKLPFVAAEEPKDLEKGNMIFPKLDKESPVSSTHDVTSTASVKAEGVPLASPNSEKSDLEIFEDAENLSLVQSSDEDDGFLTDEEYDILDASDEEFSG